ncbi:MAG: hypothetical protein GY872_07480 [Roseibacillus sp.]|nr:hypothetical protein [Myxococcales bacterium]MCP4729903.1 hypothetical protein [Roseibacillus sp.]
MLNVNELEVKKGDKVLPAWKKLVSWIRRSKVITGPGIRLSFTPQGVVAVVNREESPWKHPWKCSVGDTAYVRPGTVEGVVASMMDDNTKTLRRLDERDKDGNKTDDGPPRLKINFKKHDDEGKFYIWLNAEISDSGTLDNTVEGAVTVTQERIKRKKGQPLAVVYLDESRTSVVETFQIAHHNYKVQLQTTDTAGINRQLFLPE